MVFPLDGILQHAILRLSEALAHGQTRTGRKGPEMTIMQAITTKYVGPSNTKPGRIIATTASGLRLSVNYPHDLTTDDAHRMVAQKLADKYGWTGKMVAGGLKNGFAFVFVD